ncbi:MAG: hypothetical protein M1819_003088 [Sarea resinae]|nr:MAG: hypothetical protein M1819_003088 [Sarea resinae]
MIIKKAIIVPSSCTGFHSFCQPNHQLTTSPPPFTLNLQSQSPSTPTQSRNWPGTGTRTYATVNEHDHHHRHDRRHGHRHEHLHWPHTPSAHATPTPYQIFNQKKGAPYSKRRYYELVKLYHPDRYHLSDDTGPDSISHAVRLERYRLVVAANDILSDPSKRSAYDRYGAGWNGHPHIGSRTNGRGWADAHAWGGHSPAGNATWEDWEKWYQRDAKSPQEPVYFSNGVFVSLIGLLAALGGIVQGTRANNFSNTLLDHHEEIHKSSSEDLRRAREGVINPGTTRDERIQSFLRMREPVDYDLSQPQVQTDPRRLLPPPPPDVCASGGMPRDGGDGQR